MDEPATMYVAAIADEFRLQRSLAERAIAQLDDHLLFRTTGVEGNSVAVLMKHMGGNLRSRWTEPFTTDGEKPDRNRDGEFVVDTDTAAAVRAVWDSGWNVLETLLSVLRPDDLSRTVVIRGESKSMAAALQRSLGHTAQHVGQIILLAKQWLDADWQTLSIPRAPRTASVGNGGSGEDQSAQ